MSKFQLPGEIELVKNLEKESIIENSRIANSESNSDFVRDPRKIEVSKIRKSVTSKAGGGSLKFFKNLAFSAPLSNAISSLSSR